MKEQIDYEVTENSIEPRSGLSGASPNEEQKKDNWLKTLLANLIASYQTSNHFQHMVTGFILAMFGTFFSALFWAEAKERHDATHGGIYDRSDIYWTLVGGLLGQIIQVLIILIIVNIIELWQQM